MSSQYRILCEVHGYQYVWSDELVTTCPINPSDPLNEDATCITAMSRASVQISPSRTKTTNADFLRVASAVFDANTFGSLRQVGIFSYAERGITSYTVEVYDKTNFRSIATATFTNLDDYAINKINIPEELVSSNSLLEINVSVNSTIKGKNVFISQIIFYTV